MATRIQLRRGTSANWAAINPVLALGEPGFETDTGILRIGDGKTAFTALTPIITLGGIINLQEQVITNISNSTTNAVKQIEKSSEETIENLNELGEIYTNEALSIASEMSGLKSCLSMLYGRIDGGGASSVYIESDSINCGNSTAEFNIDDVISGGNAQTSKIPVLNLEVNISDLNNFQVQLDLLTNRITALESFNFQSQINSLVSRITSLETLISGGKA